MFNVTIIRLKDIVKIIVILIAIYILSKFIFNNISIKGYLNQLISFNTSDFIKLGINTESNIIKVISKNNKQEENEKTEEVEEDIEAVSIKSILQIGTNVFNVKELEKKSEENEDSKNNIEMINNQETAQTSEVLKDCLTQIVTKNPIVESYNKEYNGIKIKNETSYELTDDILNTNNLNIDTKDIIIFHTHTCESYTQSDKYKYTPSRKL